MTPAYKSALGIWRATSGRPRDTPQYTEAGEDGMIDELLKNPGATRSILLLQARRRAVEWWVKHKRRERLLREICPREEGVLHDGFAYVDWADFIEDVTPLIRSHCEPDSDSGKWTTHVGRKVLAVIRDFTDNPTYNRRRIR